MKMWWWGRDGYTWVLGPWCDQKHGHTRLQGEVPLTIPVLPHTHTIMRRVPTTALTQIIRATLPTLIVLPSRRCNCNQLLDPICSSPSLSKNHELKLWPSRHCNKLLHDDTIWRSLLSQKDKYMGFDRLDHFRY